MSAARPVIVIVALAHGGVALGWDRFDQLPNAAKVRASQNQSAALLRSPRPEVRFAPDGSAVAWREGESWRSLPLPAPEAPADAFPLDLSTAKTLEAAPDWPAWSPPAPRFPDPPAPPPPPGRGLQALSATAPGGQRTAHHRNANVVITGPEGDEVVTTEGDGVLRYGNASWVYGEELDQTTAMWWSPDGRYLAYYRFDDSPVLSVPMLTGQTSIRPKVESLPYPKPGEPNPVAGLEIYDTQSKRRVTVDVGPGTDQYIYWCRWTPDSSALMFNRTNRHQNLLEVLLADPQSGESRLLLHETQETWQANHPSLRFLSDGDRFIWESERSGNLQYELWSLSRGRLAEITRHDFPVQSIVRVDEANGRLWYTALGSEIRINPQLFVASLDGSRSRRLTPRDRHYSNFSISHDGRWFTATEQFVDEAPSLRLFHVGDDEVTEAAVLRPSEPDPWSSHGFTPPEFFTCTAADGVTPLYGILFKPRDFDPSRRYPLLIDVYGGPGIQTVSTRAAAPNSRCDFGLLIAKVDNRGTPGRGKAFEGATYLRLGGPDIDDQAAAARFLAERPYVDASRIGITGHSYGGYATIMALLRHPELFRVGVAGAAVTDWRQYDTIYTERYMRTPQENPEGYDAGSAVKLAGNLRGRLLLIHGLVDDNVHATNAWALSQELLRRNIPFEMMIFPEADHGVHGPAAEGIKWSFILRNLGITDSSGDSADDADAATAPAGGGSSGADGARAPRPSPAGAPRPRTRPRESASP